MRKSSKQQEKLFTTLAKEAEEDIKKNGTISWEEFWKYADKIEEDERRKIKYINQNTIQLHLATWLGKISKRFIKA